MKIKNILDEDFVNYKVPSMYIAFPFCSFKCEKDCGIKCCQNSDLAKSKTIDYDDDVLINRYLSNPITKAIVCCGLEPFDSFDDLLALVHKLRSDYKCADDIVIYTGYYKDEILEQINLLRDYPNIIIKFGRYIPNQLSRKDPIIGVNLASLNQYAEKIS